MHLAGVQDLLHRGRYLRGLREAEALADSPDLPCSDRIEALFLACEAAGLLNMPHRAAEHAARARGLAEAMGNQPAAVTAWFHAGKAALDSGDWHEAEAKLLAFLAAAQSYPGLADLVGTTEYNLAVAYEGLRRVDAALGLYRRVVPRLLDAGERRVAVMALQNAAWLVLLSGRVGEATELLAESSRLLSGATDEQRAHQIVLEGFIQLRSAQYTEAIELCEEILSAQRAGATDWDRAAAAWVAGSAALDLGRADMARSLLRVAMRYAAGSRDTKLMNLVSDLNRQLSGLSGE